MLLERRGRWEPQLEIEGFGRAAFVLVANCDPYSYAGHVRIRVAPAARFEDGIDFVAPMRVRPHDVPRLLRYRSCGARAIRSSRCPGRPRPRPDRRALRSAAAAAGRRRGPRRRDRGGRSRRGAMRSLCWCSAASLLLAGGGGAPRDPIPSRTTTRAARGATRASSCQAKGRGPRRLLRRRERLARERVPDRSADRRPPPGRALPARQRRQPRGPAAAGGRARDARRRDDDDLAAERRGHVQAARRQCAPRARSARRTADVDAARLGLVGFSLGAQTAAILAGDEPRLKAIGIIAGRGNATSALLDSQGPRAPVLPGRDEGRGGSARAARRAHPRRARPSARALVRHHARHEPQGLRRPDRLAGRP